MTSAPGAAGTAPSARRDARRVALVARKGRFLVAEPFFPAEPGTPGRAHGRREQLVIAPARPSRARSAAQAREGELVLVDVAASGRARLREVIGKPDRAADVIEALMLDRGLARKFPPSLERDARAARAASGTESQAGRADFRPLATFTVDPASARDFDDAISAEPLDGGGVRVWVHIADVSAYVEAGSPLDREAAQRGTSVYVPGTVEPMLPAGLSGDLCSLRPGAERLAVTVELDLRDGEPARVAFHRSVIRSDARLEYDQVDRIFAGAERAASPWGEALAAARVAAAQLARRRLRRGALELDSFEPDVALGAHGEVSVRMTGWSGALGEALGELRDEPATAARGLLAPSESRRMIEHFMIAANEAVARRLVERRAPCLYRVHERPEPQRVERLVAQLASLGVPTPPVPEPMSASQAADVLADAARSLCRHLDARPATQATGRLALSALVLRSLQQARYSPRNIGHAGLASAAYCHFTSPIRRYPDLVCHRALLATLGAGESVPASTLSALGDWASEREREAMEVERDATDVARCFALEQALFREGWEHAFGGEVTGLIGGGAFVAFGGDQASGELPPFEGMLPVRRLRTLGAPSDAPALARRGALARGQGEARGVVPAGHSASPAREWWELNDEGTALHATPSGRVVRLGQPLAVVVRRVDAARGRVDLGLAERSPRTRPAGRARARRR